jgi:hypothetical protein
VIGYVISRGTTVWTLPGKRLCLIHSKTSLPLTCLSFQRSATEYHGDVLSRNDDYKNFTFAYPNRLLYL